jgi:hypothetical protein
MRNVFRDTSSRDLRSPDASQASASAEPLARLRWVSRVLLVFAPDDRDPRLAAFIDSVSAARDAVDERDLVIGRMVVTGDSCIGENSVDADVAARHRSRL